MSGGEKTLVIKNEKKKKICCQMVGTSVLEMRYV